MPRIAHAPRPCLIRHACMVVAALLMLTCPLAQATSELIFSGDFDSHNQVQWIRHHALQAQGESIDLGPVLVTAVSACSGSYTIYVQVAPDLNDDSDYPEYSALKLFGHCDPGNFLPLVGNCIEVLGGVISVFGGAAELTQPSLTGISIDPQEFCGSTPVSAYAATLADVATDSDPLTPNNQPGPRTEALESVLLAVSSLTVASGNPNGGDFSVAAQGSSSPILTVSGELYSATTASPLASVTGILDRKDSNGNTIFKLRPRAASDIVP